MKEFKHLGVYGLIIEDNKIVLVKNNDDFMKLLLKP